MELRHLRYLIAVADAGSFVAASAKLHLAQPALSRQIRDLEHEIGTALFVRDPDGVRLTPAGEQSVGAARKILADVDAAVTRARLADRGLVGKCVIGAGRYPIWNGMLARAVGQARADYPGIEVVVEEFSAETQWNALAEARVDIAIGTAPSRECPAFAVETQSLDVLDGIVVARTHHLASRSSVQLRDLEPETWIHYSATMDDEATRNLLAVFARVGFNPAVRKVVANSDALRLLVRSGAGWSALPRSLRQLNTGLVAVPVEDLGVPFRYVHMHRRGDTRPVLRSILRSLRKCAAVDAAGPGAGEPPSGIRALQEGPSAAARLELRHLRYFTAIVQYESIGRAAEALELTQPALSRQLRDLEAEVGVALFARQSRGVVPTLAGQALHADALVILAAAERMACEAQRAVRGTAGDCVVGVVTSPLVWETVTEAFADCSTRWPDIEVRLEDVPTPRQGTAIREARIDVGLCHRYPIVADLDPGLAREHLLPDSLCMALLDRNHPLAQEPQITLSQLADFPFLFMKRAFSPGLYDHVMSTFARSGFQPRVEAEHDGLTTVWALAAQRLGWCLGSASQQWLPPNGLAAVRIADFNVSWGVELIYRREESRASVLTVIESIRRCADAMRAGMGSQENKYWPATEASA